MSRSAMSFVKGMGAGAIAGMAVAAASTLMLTNKKAVGKSCKKAVDAVGDIVDSVREIFK